MSRIASKLDKDLKTTLVQSYILSKLDYCNSLYTSINKDLLNRLQSVQNASANFIFGTYKSTGGLTSSSCDDLLQELHFLPVHYRILYKISLTCFKCINNFAPIYLKELINPTVCTGYNLRVDSDIFRLNVLKKPHYRKSEFSFEHFAPLVWNALPYDVRSMSSMTSFKTALKTHYFRQAFAHLSL